MNLSSTKSQRIVFILCLINAIFWLIAQWVDVYQWKIAGAVYELLALFMLFLFVGTFAVTVIQWVKQKASFQSLSFLSLLVLFITFIILWMRE
ncbi:hypothetical protein [Lacibacter sediminis]|uniref:Uncharacterized protein n=1 Tax=Lacibacter sediminis TaxID=2760713 RepID=A0A7G5XI65_9BACT|nr:hypothetical protein [Lacibacter sediminis]QNA45168.1 hypothetical protein H4075_02920 [Lacibacter sediminis]